MPNLRKKFNRELPKNDAASARIPQDRNACWNAWGSPASWLRAVRDAQPFSGQTRGADDDEIYQNRVARTSTVLIPFAVWVRYFAPPANPFSFERGYIVLISPDEYFPQKDPKAWLANVGLVLGKNCLVFYETRNQWNAYQPDALKWKAAQSRLDPLGGQYIARISATTALDNGAKINFGFTSTANKGAGIRVYEYAGEQTIADCRYQLEALFWLCHDADAVVTQNGMTAEDASARKAGILEQCEKQNLLDMQALQHARIVSKANRTICPLCLEPLSSQGFFSRMEQAEGRAVLDLTITQLNLFHISELRMGVFNHRPYNLGWGHHHCNVVVKDAGIHETLRWMDEVLSRNVQEGHFPEANKGN